MSKKHVKYTGKPSNGHFRSHRDHTRGNESTRDREGGNSEMHDSIFRTVTELAAEQDNSDTDEEQEIGGKKEMGCKVYMWEFGQNDPKRDSGSKLRRLGYAGLLRIGQSFPGVVLSSEAKTFVSAADSEIVRTHGIGCINCSWNRLTEIPFGSMGKGRNQRILPLLFAANSVNYGRPFKMNTAEAMAACLYITGHKEDAHVLLSPFGYGEEFIRLNFDALEAYSSCSTPEEVHAVQEEYVRVAQLKVSAKEEKRLLEASGLGGGYMDDMDLPPLQDFDEEYGQGEGEEEEEFAEGDVGGQHSATVDVTGLQGESDVGHEDEYRSEDEDFDYYSESPRTAQFDDYPIQNVGKAGGGQKRQERKTLHSAKGTRAKAALHEK